MTPSAAEPPGMQPYTDDFYRHIHEESRRSASVVVPLVVELVHPKSVVDVGCGTGVWLAAFREHGVADVVGVDGNWVDRATLEIPEERFVAADLTRPLQLDREFDLVVSLEVAEHLPAESAETLVTSLTALGQVVLFSAAIPFQGGTHHVNEQWQAYWTLRFGGRGFVPIDCIRARVWEDPRVDFRYAQNILLYIRPEVLHRYPALAAPAAQPATLPISVVHPRQYLEALGWFQRLQQAAEELADLLPPGAEFILVDQDQLGRSVTGGRRAVPFLEKDGVYWGPPADDATAIRELERLRAAGASFVVFAWPAFWWLDYYAGLQNHLRARFRRVLANGRLVAFDLRP